MKTRKLKLMVQLSVDGCMSDKNGNTDWMVFNWGNNWTWDDNLKMYFTDLMGSVDCVLLGRKMATDGYIDHWTKVAAEPGNPQSIFAKDVVDAQKVIFSKTLKKVNWDRTTIANGDLVSEVDQLKKQPGKDMIVFGGATFVAELISNRLIDEYYLFINPAAVGDGIAIFRQKTYLKLRSAQAFECGVLVAEYGRG